MSPRDSPMGPKRVVAIAPSCDLNLFEKVVLLFTRQWVAVLSHFCIVFELKCPEKIIFRAASLFLSLFSDLNDGTVRHIWIHIIELFVINRQLVRNQNQMHQTPKNHRATPLHSHLNLKENVRFSGMSPARDVLSFTKNLRIVVTEIVEGDVGSSKLTVVVIFVKLIFGYSSSPIRRRPLMRVHKFQDYQLFCDLNEVIRRMIVVADK